MSIAVETARVALLGCGTVGRAFATLSRTAPAATQALHITAALVRDTSRPRPLDLPPLTDEARLILQSEPDVLVELLGGTEPARSLVLEALQKRIPVVTANKTLLAHHGAELREAAHRTNTPLLYEAAVIAGVPFLGTFNRRPRAANVRSLLGILNGTSNFILTRCATANVTVADALADAQRRGYAEPDPRDDVQGIDARDKLALLLQHFAHVSVPLDAIETRGLDAIGGGQAVHARELGGAIKPVVSADWTEGAVDAFVGPAFVPHTHPLATVNGVENAIVLRSPGGRLIFQGPGAGPEITAATVLDDVDEALAGVGRVPARVESGSVTAPATGWLVTLDAARLPGATDVADLLASHGLFASRTTSTHSDGGREVRSLLLWPARRTVVERALAALCGAAGCTASSLRALEVEP
ncbi:MAG: homoserine dehydrogenase [Acidobacteriota bacterium]|nr:homoserine dehydrogenase [Acidobacteriota bacterium]MDQ3419713.1 homoserine dehydrogenase [Acidobacteriota bacterium]